MIVNLITCMWLPLRQVLTCLGIHLWERLHRLWQKLRAEEQTWQMLFFLGIDALRKNFEVCLTCVTKSSGLVHVTEKLRGRPVAAENGSLIH